METIVIEKYRIVPAPATGIGWVAVQAWNGIVGAYEHLSTHRTKGEADGFIANLLTVPSASRP
jgi:hypothetical protein